MFVVVFVVIGDPADFARVAGFVVELMIPPLH